MSEIVYTACCTPCIKKEKEFEERIKELERMSEIHERRTYESEQ